MSQQIDRTARRKLYGKASASKHNQDKVALPPRCDLTVSPGRIQTVWAHQLVARHFEQTLAAAMAAIPQSNAWIVRRIDSHVYRKIRGSTRVSMHSYGLAWDIFATGPTTPPPGGVWTPTAQVPAEFVAVYETAGFTWGGRWRRRPDTPHFEWRRAAPGPTALVGSIPPPPPAPAKHIDRKDELVTITMAVPVLSKGSSGGWVVKMQKLLEAHDPGGALVPLAKRETWADGDFGPATDAALRAWQQMRGMSVDGEAGPKTWQELIAG